MKKAFATPEIFIVLLAEEDILTTSYIPPVTDNENDGEWD